MNEIIKDWNFFRKVEYVKGLVNKALPDVSIEELRLMISRISHKKYGHKALPLVEEEVIIRDILLKHNLNSGTVYSWFLMTQMPEDVQYKLKRGLITKDQAFKLSANRRWKKHIGMGLLIMEDIRDAIRQEVGYDA